MPILDALAIMTKNIVAQEGQSVKAVFVETGEYDPDTASCKTIETKIDCKAIFLDLAIESHGDLTYGGTLIEKGDREVYLPYNSLFPRKPSPTGDYLLDIKNSKWRIVQIKENNPSGVNEILYKLLVRR